MNTQEISNFFTSYKVLILIAVLWILDWCMQDYEEKNTAYIKEFYNKHKRKSKE